MITDEKSSLSKLDIDPKSLIQYSLIFCPINIRNIHWTLLVINPKTGSVFFLDPLQEKTFHRETIAKSQKLLDTIIMETGIENLQTIKEYDQFYTKQSNSNDCGPFICAFAERIAAGKSLINIDARRIRYLTYCHLPTTTLAPLLEGGSGLQSNPNVKLPSHLLHFDDSHIASFSFTNAESKTVTVVHPLMSKAICTHNAEFLVNNVRLPDFHNKRKILLPLLVNNSYWILIIGDLEDNLIYFMDPMKHQRDQHVENLVSNAAATIVQLTLHEKQLRLIDAPHFQRSSNQNDSGPLICGYMESIANNRSPTEIDIDRIRKICNSLKKRFTRFQQFSGPNTTSSIPNCATRQTRVQLAESLVHQIENLPISEAAEAIVQHTYLLRSKTPKSNYMGLHQELHFSAYDLRKLYKQNSKRAFQIITQHVTADVYPKTEDIFNYYNLKATEKPIHPGIGGLPVNQGPTLSFYSITKEQLISTIKALNKNSAPGRSNITYHDILYCDPELSLHLALFNKILDTGDIPNCWKEFETLLVPKPMKQGHYQDVSSWRPIALLDCQYKLFTAVLASHIHQWCIHNNLLHPLQKSLGPFDGCTEHNFLIRAIFDKYENQWKQPIHAIFLDIADAFGTISIDIILDLVERMGLHISACQLIKQLYTDCSHRIICGSLKTDDIPVKLGVRQGCPLSMILFNIGINPLLLLIDKISAGGTKIGNHRIAGLAFADDLVLLAPSKPAAQQMADAAQMIANVLGLTFRSSKCSLLSIPQNNNNELIINNEKITIIKPGEIQIYLGTDLGHFTSSTPTALFQRLINEYTAIAHSGLTPWQKLHAKTIHIHSALIFAFRNFLIPMSEIYCNKNRNTIQRRIRKLDKKILGLNHSASNAYLYSPRDFGGVGLTSIVDEYLAQSLAHAIQIFNCRDLTTRDAAFMFLRRCATGKHEFDLVSIEQAFAWLNKKIENNSAVCWWSRVKYAIGKMSKLHDTRVEFKLILGEVSLHIHQTINERNKTYYLINKSNLKEASKCLHILFAKSWYNKWVQQPSAGRFVLAIAESTLNKSIIYSGELSVSEWNLIHQCNTATLPVLAIPGTKNKGKCRRCREKEEDLPHVLVGCETSELFWHLRHNTIVYFLGEQFRLHTDAIVKIDHECEYTGRKQRVDIVLEYARNSTILLVDVKCPYQTMEGIDRSDSSNKFHYTDLAKDIASVMPSWTVEVHTVVVGTPGTWPVLSTKTLTRIGLRSTTIKTIARHCIASNIRWSTAQWRFHRDGIMSDYSRLTNIQLIPSLTEPEPTTEVNLLDDLVAAVNEIDSENEWLDLTEIFDDETTPE